MAVHQMKFDDQDIKIIAGVLRKAADQSPNDKLLAFLARRFETWGMGRGKHKRPFYSRIPVKV